MNKILATDEQLKLTSDMMNSMSVLMVLQTGLLDVFRNHCALVAQSPEGEKIVALVNEFEAKIRNAERDYTEKTERVIQAAKLHNARN